MNTFSSFQSQLFRGGTNTNAFGFINKSAYGIILDPCGNDASVLVDENLVDMTNAYRINSSSTNTCLEVKLSNNILKATDILPNTTSDMTLYVKYKYNTASTDQSIFSQLFPSPVASVDVSNTNLDVIAGEGPVYTIEPGQSFDVYYLVAGADTITYTISGVLDSVSLPMSGYLLETYEKKTVTLGSDASSGIIDFYVNDNLLNSKVYVPFRYTVERNISTMGTPNDFGDDQNVFYVDTIERKTIEQYPGIHYFDLSDPLMSGNTFQFSYYPDNNDGTGSGTVYTIDVSSVGNPGESGAYIRILTDASTPNLHYFGNNTQMGGGFINMNVFDYEYTVKTVTNVAGQVVYAFDTNGDGTYYNQPDISFAVGSVYLFHTSEVADGYTLTFGTTEDGTPDTSVVFYGTNKVLLDLNIKTGESYKYFDLSYSGMGYVVLSERQEILLYRQTAPTYYTAGLSILRTQSLNENDPTSSQYSIMNKLYSSTTRSDYEISSGIYRFRFTDSNGYELIVEQENPFDHTNTSPNPTVISNSGFVMPSGKDWDFDGWHISNNTTYSIIEGVVGDWVRWNVVHVANSSAWDTVSDKLIAFSSDTNDKLLSDWVEFYAIKNPGSALYTVTVSGDPAVFYIDDISNPQLTFTAGETYVFDQSDSSNTGHPLVIGTTADNSGSLVSYQTVVGTPGRPGAYTSFTATSETVYYFCYNHSGMGA